MERLHEIESRKAEIKSLLESGAECDLNALEEEMNALDEEVRSLAEQQAEEQRSAEIEAEERAREVEAKADEQATAERRSIAEAIEKREVKATEIISNSKEDKMEDYRNSKEYIDAYAEYLKTGNEKRCREIMMRINVNDRVTSELTTLGTHDIAVPEFVWDIIKTNWEKTNLLRYCRRVSLPGELKVNFELSSDGAVIHQEGGEAITREQLTHGIAKLPLVSIKKIVAFSDEVYDLRGEEFVRYLYDEVTQKIYKKLEDEIVRVVRQLATTATATSVSAPVIEATSFSLDLIARAIGMLSDEASNPIVVMNKLTWSKFKALQYAASYPVDPFEGLPVVFNNTLDADETNNNYRIIVGDFGEGMLVNEITRDIEWKFDDLSRKDEDLIEIMGRKYVGYNAVADKAFVNINVGSNE